MTIFTVEYLTLTLTATVVAGTAAIAYILWRTTAKKIPPVYKQFSWPGWKAAKALGARKETGHLVSQHGGKLFWQLHVPPSDTRPRAALVFAHGIHEHCERFNHVFEELAGAHGFLVFSADHRGHGQSAEGAPSGYFGDTWDQVVDDWADVVHFAKDIFLQKQSRGEAYPIGAGAPANEPAVPIFLTGVSFGAMLTLHTVLRRPERVGKIAGCAFVAPFVDIPRPLLLRVQEAFAPILSALAPHARIVEAALPELLSKDAAAVENYVSDPLNIKEKISVRPGYLMGLATYWLKAHCAEWSTPVRGGVCPRPTDTDPPIDARVSPSGRKAHGLASPPLRSLPVL